MGCTWYGYRMMVGDNPDHEVHWPESRHHDNIQTQTDGSTEHPAGELSESVQ